MGLLLLAYLLFRNNFSFETAAVLYLFVSMITVAWYFPWKLLNRFSFSPFSTIWKVLTQSKSYAFLIFSSFAYSRGDSLIVRYSLNDVALGLYGSAYRYLESLSLIPTALAHNLFPLSAKEGIVSSQQTKKITLLMTFIGIIISIIVYLNAELFIVGILGEPYISAVPLLKVFSLVLAFFFINAPLNTIVISSSQVNKFLPYGVGNTFLNLALNLMFVPLYGVVAAAWVMLITEVTGLFINIYFVRKVYK
jgi:O-antigen/teichoic acid export membrane protein